MIALTGVLMSETAEPPSERYRLAISLSPAEKALIEMWAARWQMTLEEYVQFSVLFVAGLHPESGSAVRTGQPADPVEEVEEVAAPGDPPRPRWTSAAAEAFTKVMRLSLSRFR